MRHRVRTLALAAQCALLLSLATHAQGVTETYLFRDSFAPIEGSGNVLVPVSNATNATIVTDGPNFKDGAFVTEQISTSACASGPTIRAWSFPISGGLRHLNNAPAVISGSYTISMLLRYNPMDTGYARLIDFSNSTLDSGIYKLNNGVSFFPLGTFAAGSFVSNQDVFVTVTRDANTKTASLYINGQAAGTQVDTNNLYTPLATTMYFLMDNTTGNAAVYETDPGVIAYLQLRDTPLAPEDVPASLTAICDAVACGDGIVAGGETCDDGNTLAGDGCSPSCAVEACYTCTGQPSDCTFLMDEPACTTTTTTTLVTLTTASTTSTTTTTTTTSTTLPQGCAAFQAASYDSILCRLNALITRVQGETQLGNYQKLSLKNLQQAKARIEAARGNSNTKKVRKLLQQGGKAITQYIHRLSSHTASKKLPSALRQDYIKDGNAIAPDVKALRSKS